MHILPNISRRKSNQTKKFGQLRYYATFNVRKFESLLYKINTSLQKTTTCIGLWAEQMFSVNIYIFFNFGRGLDGSFPMLFPKAPVSWCKKIWTNFCCIVLLYLNSKNVSQIFKILFQTGILIFLPFVVSFLDEMFK